MELSDFGRKYLLLGLRINKWFEKEFDEKYVEAYFGPIELDLLVKNEKSTPTKKLLMTCKSLQKELKNQGFEEERKKFIGKMLKSMKIMIIVLSEAEISYIEQVQGLYDIIPRFIDDSKFYKLAEEANSVYKGSGTLLERIKETNKRRTIHMSEIVPLYQKTLKRLRTDTQKLYSDIFPSDEKVSVITVSDKSWGAYNWFLGNAQSRIEVNTDLPIRWSSILNLSAHEGYPGHHTEHMIKESLLYLEQQRFEHCIIIVISPEAVICEGLAQTGLSVLYSLKDSVDFELNEICPNPSHEDPNNYYKEKILWKNVMGLMTNAALHAHVDNWSDVELVEYIMQFGFYSEERCRQSLKFIRNPLWRTFYFTYTIGEDIIKKRFGERPSPKDFRTLLTKPILPSDLRL